MSTAEEKVSISSAEMTAIYRSQFPAISGDSLSKKLASLAGEQKAQEFSDKYQYPLIYRKISARAGFLLSEASRLVASNVYDSVISFASGFSLLTYYIAKNIPESTRVNFVDTDLESILTTRETRLTRISKLLSTSHFTQMKSRVLDLEMACARGQSLIELFPEYKSPVFIIEGVIYFLSEECVQWLIEQVAQYPQAAIVMDYWPDDMQAQSALFKRVFVDINKFIPEQTKSFWNAASMAKLKSLFQEVNDYSISEVEKILSVNAGVQPELVDKNHYFPLRVLSAEKGHVSLGRFRECSEKC